MSAGSFLRSKYECLATGQIHPIRVQQETVDLNVAAVDNDPPAGALSSPVSAQVSRSRRALGINARTVTIVFRTAAPTGYKVGSPITLPWLSAFPDPGFIRGQTATYLATTAELVSFAEEKVN